MRRQFNTPMTPEEFQRTTGISHKTLRRLRQYVETLRQWQTHINLLGTSTLQDVWRRHILDAAQLKLLIPPKAQLLVDFGSGAGFPGLVLAILGVSDVHLIESNSRKGAFLKEVARLTETSVTLHLSCSGEIYLLSADVITARAVAPLNKLLALTAPFLASREAIGLFLKGQTVNQELVEARKYWDLKIQKIPSQSDPTGVILHVSELCYIKGSKKSTWRVPLEVNTRCK